MTINCLRVLPVLGQINDSKLSEGASRVGLNQWLKFVIAVFGRIAVLRNKSKYWLTRYRYNVSEWNDISICGVLLQWASCWSSTKRTSPSSHQNVAFAKWMTHCSLGVKQQLITYSHVLSLGRYRWLSSFPPAISTCWLHKQNSYKSSRELSWTYQQWAGVITKFSQHLNDNSCEDDKSK
jgi:hypothetical protein